MIRVSSLMIVLGIFITISNSGFAATIWVNPAGSNTSPYSTKAIGRHTIADGIASASPGDTIIIADGTYCQNSSQTIVAWNKDGSPGNWYTIKAETDGGVVFDCGGNGYNGLYEGSAIDIESDYWQVEGFKAVNGHSVVASFHGSYIKVLRSGFANVHSNAGGWSHEIISMGGDHLLFEDVWTWGAGRTHFSGGTLQNTIFRRCISRWDGSMSVSNNPNADTMFNFRTYNLGGGDTQNVLFQNSIVLDNNTDDTGTSVVGDSAAFRIRTRDDQSHDISFYGSIVLNLDSDPDWDAYIISNQVDYGNNIYNSIAWNVGGNAVRLRSPTGTDKFELHNNTFGNIGDEGIYTNGELSYVEMRNNIWKNVSGDINASDAVGNNYFNTTNTPGNNSVTFNPELNGLIYPNRIEEDSNLKTAGPDGSQIGATILYKYGVSGTLWGEAGYDQLTAAPLWPWPHQDRIRNDMRTPLTWTMSGLTPATNDWERGFCADDQSLTKYIWESLGNAYPVSSLPPVDISVE